MEIVYAFFYRAGQKSDELLCISVNKIELKK